MRKIVLARVVLYAVAIGAVIILFDFVVELRRSAEEQQMTDLRAETTVFTQDVKRIISTTIDNVSSVGAFFESSDVVNEQEFSRFVIRSNLLTGQNHVRSIAVMPLIKSDNLSKFITALDARQDVRATVGYGSTEIKLVDGRDLYAPSIYVESAEGRDEMLGYDLASDPERMRIARASLLAFQPHMTTPTRLVLDGDKNRLGVMIIGAVKSAGNLGLRNYLPTQADRSLLIVASISPDIVINGLIRAHGATRFTLRVSDQTDDVEKTIFETPIRFDTTTKVQQTKVVLGNRVWVFDYGYPGLVMRNPVVDRFMFLGLIGAVAILALAVALDRLLRIRGRLEQDVRDRTMELENVNTALLETAQKASAESEAKSMFLAHMSHELRTPLNAVIGYGQMLQAEIFGKIGDERYLDYAKTIVDAGTIQLSLVEDLLALSALESDGRDLTKSDIDIKALANRCLDLVRTTADEKSITLRLNTVVGDAILSSDERAVQQILTNLLSNAVKFTGEGGHVSVNIDQNQNGQTIIAIEDDGIGIPEGQVDKVLQPFSRAHADPYHTHEGVGLGLSIVRGLAGACGATVRIKSTQGIGTRVTVRFPVISSLPATMSET